MAGPRGPAMPCVRCLRADQLDADTLRVIELAVEAGRPAVPEAVDLRRRPVAIREVGRAPRHRRARDRDEPREDDRGKQDPLHHCTPPDLSLIHISEPTRLGMISY